MEKAFVEFDKKCSIDEIYNELLYYKKEGIMVSCKYKDYYLENNNDDKLRMKIEQIKMEMNDSEYKNHKSEEEITKAIEQILLYELGASARVRYWINSTKDCVKDDSKILWEIRCYQYLKNHILTEEEIIYICYVLSSLEITNNELEFIGSFKNNLFYCPNSNCFEWLLKMLEEFSSKQDFLQNNLYKFETNYIKKPEISESVQKMKEYVLKLRSEGKNI